MVPRETVTEHRLDALEKKVDAFEKKVDVGFKQVDARFVRVEGELRELRAEMHAGFASLNRTLLGGAVAVIVALIGSSATLAGIAFL